jgi:CBS-domain-containing membrane protein
MTSQASSSAIAELWRQPVSALRGLVRLAPPVTHPDDQLPAIVEAFARDPGARAIFVIDDDDHLLGWIREESLDADLLTLMLPRQLWSESDTMDTRAVLRAARGTSVTARELMGKVRAVVLETRLSEAVGVMSRSRQSVAPLVDAEGRLLGYLRLLEVLAHVLRSA